MWKIQNRTDRKFSLDGLNMRVEIEPRVSNLKLDRLEFSHQRRTQKIILEGRERTVSGTCKITSNTLIYV